METSNDMQAFRQQIILSLLRNEAFSCGHDPNTGAKVTFMEYGKHAITAADSIINAMQGHKDNADLIDIPLIMGGITINAKMKREDKEQYEAFIRGVYKTGKVSVGGLSVNGADGISIEGESQFEKAATAGLKHEIETLRNLLIQIANGEGYIVNTSDLETAQIGTASVYGRLYFIKDRTGKEFRLVYMPASIYNHGTRRPTDVQAAEISALRQENEALKENYRALQDEYRELQRSKTNEFIGELNRANVKTIVIDKDVTPENLRHLKDKLSRESEITHKLMEQYELACEMNDYYDLVKQYRKADHHWTNEIAELKRKIETLEHTPPMIIGMDNYVDLPITLDGIHMIAKIRKEDKRHYDECRRTTPPNVEAFKRAVSQPEQFIGQSWNVAINDETKSAPIGILASKAFKPGDTVTINGVRPLGNLHGQVTNTGEEIHIKLYPENVRDERIVKEP